MIFGKSDVYIYLEDVYYQYKILGDYYDSDDIVSINKIYIDIYKTKPLNGSSYIALPEYIANKKAVINI